MLCSLHRHYPWSIDLFIHVPFQLPFGAYGAATISAIGTYHLPSMPYQIIKTCTHLHLSEVKHVRAKYIAQGHSIETVMSQRYVQPAVPLCHVPLGNRMSIVQFPSSLGALCLLLLYEPIRRECITT